MAATSVTQVLDFELATSYRRVVARLIDLGVGMFTLLMVGLMVAMLIDSMFDISDDVFGFLLIILFILLLIGYDILMHHLFGKTLGKILLGLRVVDGNGDKLSWGMCILRAILTYLMAIGIIFLTAVTASLFGWIVIGSLGRYRRFPNDTATHSFVVREIKGQLVTAKSSGQVQPGKPNPLADLDRLFEQGMISKEELDRKKREILDK